MMHDKLIAKRLNTKKNAKSVTNTKKKHEKQQDTINHKKNIKKTFRMESIIISILLNVSLIGVIKFDGFRTFLDDLVHDFEPFRRT